MNFLSRINRSRANIFVSGINSPKISNAFESYLFNSNLNCPNLFIRRSTPTVVLGQNQNPWIECNLQQMKADNVELTRRTTGGGAVYLDPGNMLVGFLGNITNYPKLSKKDNNKIIIDSISDVFDVKAVPSGRNDIVVGEKKVAGAAFKYNTVGNQEYTLHHMSILVNADLDALQKYLTPDKRKLESKGVKSVRSRVENLQKRVSLDGTIENFSSEAILSKI